MLRYAMTSPRSFYRALATAAREALSFWLVGIAARLVVHGDAYDQMMVAKETQKRFLDHALDELAD